jgi:exodeoxyribonuclease V alpha subunit
MDYSNIEEVLEGLDESEPPSGGERRKGTISAILFDRAGKTFKLLKVEQEDGDVVVWKGTIDLGEDAQIRKGDVIEAVGKTEYYRGEQQFVVDNILQYLPTSRGGLVTWLMARLPDIGEKRAAALAKAFPGEHLFATIRDYPDQLTRVAGITEARAQKIHDVYMEYAHEAQVVIELVDLNLGWIKVTRAVKLLGIEEVKRILKENPYEFVDVPGWSFGYIDKWVRQERNPYGMQYDDPRRVVAKYRDFLNVLANAGYWDWDRDGGDCYMDELGVSAIARQMGWLPSDRPNARPRRKDKNFWEPPEGSVPRYTPAEIAALLRESPHFAIHNNALLLSELDAAERLVADILRKRAVDKPVQMLDLPSRISLDESQKMAASALVQLPVCCMTGGPGTGKTTTLRTALDAMAARGETLALASFTGKAARRMGQATGRPASTIHKLLEWTPSGFRRNGANPIEADVVVIDEASMLDIQMAANLLDALDPHTRLLLVGDSNQLPPVGPGQPFTDILRAHDSYGNYVVPVYRLTTVHRQAGENWVIDSAPLIIADPPKPLPSLKELNSADGSFRFYEAASTREVVALVLRMYRTASERGEEQQLQVLTPMRRPDPERHRATAYEINTAVQKELNPRSLSDDKRLYFDGGFNEKAPRYRIFEGDKVIFTRNTPKLGLSNGDTGVVVEVRMDNKKSENSYAKVRFDGLEDTDHPDGIYTLVGENFQHVDLAYAMTVHKSQGSEWANVVFVADERQSRMLKRQLFYTAVTRTSRNLRIFGTVDGIRTAVNSKMSNERWTLLTSRLLDVPI